MNYPKSLGETMGKLRGSKPAAAMSAEEIAELNACGHYLLVGVLRRAGRDCSMRGATSRLEYMFIPHPEGPTELRAEDEHMVLSLLPPIGPNCPVRVKPRAVIGHSMAGGNFVYSSDSRFAELYGAPLSVHDRVES